MDMIALSVILIVLTEGIAVAIISFFAVRKRDQSLKKWIEES